MPSAASLLLSSPCLPQSHSKQAFPSFQSIPLSLICCVCALLWWSIFLSSLVAFLSQASYEFFLSFFSCFIFSPSRLQGQMPLSSSLPISLPLAFSIFFVFLPAFRSLFPGRVTLKLWNTIQKNNLKLDFYSFSRKRMQTSPPWCYTAIGGSLGVGMQLLSSSSTKIVLVCYGS